MASLALMVSVTKCIIKEYNSQYNLSIEAKKRHGVTGGIHEITGERLKLVEELQIIIISSHV
jgi:hypothetical protein